MNEDLPDAVSIANLTREDLKRRLSEREETELSECPDDARDNLKTLFALRRYVAASLSEKHGISHLIREHKGIHDTDSEAIADLELQLSDIEARIEKMMVWIRDLSKQIEEARDESEADQYSGEASETARTLIRTRRRLVETAYSKVGEAEAGEFGSVAGTIFRLVRELNHALNEGRAQEANSIRVMLAEAQEREARIKVVIAEAQSEASAVINQYAELLDTLPKKPK